MKLGRYFLVGGASAAIDLLVFTGGILLLGHDNWFLVAAVSFVIATAFNYVFSVRFVFVAGVRFSRTNEIMLIFLASLIGLTVNQTALWLFYKVGGIHIVLSKIMATGAAFFWNFAARNNYIFRAVK